MPNYDLKCTNDKCGAEWTDVLAKVDEMVPCASCQGPTVRVWSSRKSQIIGDDIPGGMWLENYGPEPVKVYSHTERKRLAAQVRVDAKGSEYRLTEMVRHVPVPGTNKSPHTTDWGNKMDPQTLANAKALVERVGGGSKVKVDPRDLEEAESKFRDPSIREFNIAGTTEDAIKVARLK